MSSRVPGVRIRLFVFVLALVVLAVACGGDEYVPAGIVRTPLPDVSEVALPDATNGGEMQMVAEQGGVLVVYFGYTACPDVCPTTMADLRTSLRNLGDRAAAVDVAMVTVDPGRDSADVLNGYVHTFVPDGHALRTDDPDELAAAAEPFGVQYEVSVLEDGWIDVVHTGFLYAVDDEGRVQLTWPFGIEAELIEADLRALLDQEGKLSDA